MDAGEMKEESMDKFNQLLELVERYKHLNQYK